MTLPSGSDPTQYSLTDGIFGIGGEGLGFGVSGLQNLTQGFVTNHYSANLQTSPGWGDASNVFFNVIMGGFQSISDFLAQLTQSITGAVGTGFTALSDFFIARANEVLDLFDNVQNIADSIFNAAFNVVTSNNPITAIFDAIAHLLGGTQTAQSTANEAVSGVAVLNAQTNGVGTVLLDSFDRSADTNLGAGWTTIYQPGGVGYIGTDGSGNAHWTAPGGSAPSSWGLSRKNTPLATNVQAASVVLTTNVPQYSTGDNPEQWITLRANAAQTEYTVAKIGWNWVEIGYAIGGTYTRLGPRTTGISAQLGLWEFRAGTISNDREFTLLQGSTEVARRFDATSASVMDSSHRYPGMGEYTGSDISFFFVYNQGTPSDLQVWTGIDRVATA